jgi:RHS repeat-associated protein
VHTSVDRLGSVTSLTNDDKSLTAGSSQNDLLIQRRAYDIFGRAFEAYSNSSQPFSELSIFEVTKKGFTNHEHLPDVGLIHMNGRGYDPLLGRFLSVDPFIQSPTNTQSVNPYTYIFNNPLSGTDPSGYKGEDTDVKEQPEEDKGVAHKSSCMNSIKKVGCSGGAATVVLSKNSSSKGGAKSKTKVEFSAGKPNLAGSSAAIFGGVAAAETVTGTGTSLVGIAKGLGEGVSESLKKGGVIGVGLTPVPTATDEEMQDLVAPIKAANQAESEGEAIKQIVLARTSAASSDPKSYAIYHREKSTSQTDTDSLMQTISQEIWGGEGLYNFSPTVRAFVGPLPKGVPGIEFMTNIKPSDITPGAQGGTWALWRQGSPGVQSRLGGDYASIKVILYKNTQLYRE